jgi:hypothetical protein
MKKFLLTLVVLASFGLTAKLHAQACSVSNVSVHLNSSTSVGGNCIINFDLTFDMQHNNGNKYAWLHIWTTAAYPGLSYGSNAPNATELAATLANVGLDLTAATPVLQSTYPAAPAVNVEDASDGLTVQLTVGGGTGGTDRYKISNVSVSVPGACNSTVNLKADLWATNSSSQNHPQCSTTGISFSPNDPTITGFKVCGTPRTITLGIHTLETSNLFVSYKLYKDDGDGIFEPGTDDALVADSVGPYTINSTTPYAKSGIGWTGNGAIGENSSIWVSVSTSLSSYTVNALFQNNCIPLPIGLRSLTASRNHSNVTINWVTSFEQNSSGFLVQRQIGTGNWQTIAFVPTQSQNGSSKFDLAYTYVDVNSAKGISNYRLVLVDLDGKSKYSDIRSVRGEGQLGKMIVYPNPSFDGRVRIVFEETNGMRDVTVNDVSGRIVKQWKGITNNNLDIDNLTPGMYTLRVVIRETGEQSIEKIIVNKR